VRAAATRAAQLPHASRQRAFLRDVPAAAAADFVARCSRRARSAASFGELVAPDALARAARCICAAAALRDGLEELGEAPQLWALAQAPPRRADDEAAPPPRGGVFADEVAACDAFVEEWAGELAAAVASDFAATAERYSAALRRGAASPAPLLAAAVDAAAAAMLLLRALLPPLQLARVGCERLLRRGSISVLALTHRVRRRRVAADMAAFLLEECLPEARRAPERARAFAADLDALCDAWRPFAPRWPAPTRCRR
jgi:hypothetical protein